MRRWTVLFGLLSATFMVAGCQLPDAGPFVDGTAQLKSAVAASGAAVEQELRHGLGADDAADQLAQNWEARNRTLTAMLRYAQSLSAIVAAGNEGAESAANVADAVRGLAEAAGVAIPGSPEAAAVATDAGKFLYSQIATVRAAGQLSRALDRAQPAVERVASLLRADLADLEVIASATAGLEALDAITDEYNTLSAQRKSVLSQLEGLDLSAPEQREEYAALTTLLADMDRRYSAYQAEIAVVEERLDAIRSVIGASGRALDEWAAAHAELASAARAKRPASTQSLLEAAAELRNLVERMRDL